MKVLLVGGSGHVGTFITPYMREKHRLRVMDLVPPRCQDVEVEYVEGSITDPDALARGLEGMDTFINLVMVGPRPPAEATTSDVIIKHYQANTLGLHLLLHTAKQLGINFGVHTSTTTVHDRPRQMRYPAEEELPLYNSTIYGLTKGFGERICRYFCREFDMNLIALRISGPRTRDQWLAEYSNPREIPCRGHLFPTDEEDLANAYLAALDAVKIGHGRFEAIFILGDVQQSEINLTKAKRLLGWEPRTHLRQDVRTAGAQ